MFKFLKSLFSSDKSNKIHVRLNAEAFKIAIADKNSQLIDVRTSAEYKSGKIKTAKLINVMASGFQDKLNSLNKEKPVYFYCRSGARSVSAAKKAVKLGFTEVYDLKGGYNTWVN